MHRYAILPGFRPRSRPLISDAKDLLAPDHQPDDLDIRDGRSAKPGILITMPFLLS